MIKLSCPFSPALLRLTLALILLSTSASLSVTHAFQATTAFTDSGVHFNAVNGAVTAWGDVDSDGDLDLILGGQMNLHDNVWGNVMKLYLNTGGLFSESSMALPGLIDGTAQWRDYDNDGDVDLLVAGSYLLRVYRNDKGTLVDSKVS
jgi:hypothetical protein